MILYNEKRQSARMVKVIEYSDKLHQNITKAENLRNKLNDKITRLRTIEMSDFNLFFYCILLFLLKHVISNLISIFKN